MDTKQGIEELLKVLKQGIVEGKELIITQFPTLCQQIIRWGIWGNISQIVIFSIMIYISYRLMQIGFKKFNEQIELKKFDENAEDGYGWGILIVGSIIGIMSFSVSLFVTVHNLLKALFAPNLYILLYLKEMIK